MRKWLFMSVLALAGMGLSAGRASAWFFWPYGDHVSLYYTPVAFPCLNPPGWYSNAYYFAWQYPWYANYNYANGYYANWWWGGGFATYGSCPCPAPHVYAPVKEAVVVVEQAGKGPILPLPKKVLPNDLPPGPAPGTVSIALPADARLIFNGVAAQGTGDKRTYLTPVLNPGQDYQYVLTAEVVRDGQTVTATERVIVRAGTTTAVKLIPATAAGK
jgi:uncharacterized protein (TIGR03000 family)